MRFETPEARLSQLKWGEYREDRSAFVVSFVFRLLCEGGSRKGGGLGSLPWAKMFAEEICEDEVMQRGAVALGSCNRSSVEDKEPAF